MGRNGSHRSAGYEIDTRAAGVGEKNNLSSRSCAFNETVDDGAEQNEGNGVERGERNRTKRYLRQTGAIGRRLLPDLFAAP